LIQKPHPIGKIDVLSPAFRKPVTSAGMSEQFGARLRAHSAVSRNNAILK